MWTSTSRASARPGRARAAGPVPRGRRPTRSASPWHCRPRRSTPVTGAVRSACSAWRCPCWRPGSIAASALQVTIGLIAAGTPRPGAGPRSFRRLGAAAGRLPDRGTATGRRAERPAGAAGALIERARAQAGDLAHGLKTSLQLLLVEADRLRDDRACAGRADPRAGHAHAARVIEHQLARARAQSRCAGTRPGAAGGGQRRRPACASSVRSPPSAASCSRPPCRRTRASPARPPISRRCWATCSTMPASGREVACGSRCAGRCAQTASSPSRTTAPASTMPRSEAVFARGARLDERMPGSGLGLADRARPRRDLRRTGRVWGGPPGAGWRRHCFAAAGRNGAFRSAPICVTDCRTTAARVAIMRTLDGHFRSLCVSPWPLPKTALCRVCVLVCPSRCRAMVADGGERHATIAT